MGQNQLLLLAVGILIVALATLAGVQSWQQSLRQAAADRLVDRGLAIATTAVAWKARNDPYNGGNQSYTGLTEGGMDRLEMDIEGAGSRFEISDVTHDSLVLTGVSVDFPEIGTRILVNRYTIESTEVRFDGEITLSDSE